jgi:hypothetical protein
MLDSALAQHLPTAAEEDRILDIATTLGLSVGDVPGLTDKFVKISILRDLDEGKIPDHVTVVGPMPFELERDETIVWIFNGVQGYRQSKPREPLPGRASAIGRAAPGYLSPTEIGTGPAPIREHVDTGIGDLMITDRHIFIVSQDRQRQIPLSKIARLKTFTNGFQIERVAADDRPLTFIVDDSWFAANLVTRLMHRASNLPKRRHETGPASVK